MESNKRCNLERIENGVRVCWGDHEKSVGCQWEDFIESATVTKLEERVKVLVAVLNNLINELPFGIDNCETITTNHPSGGKGTTGPVLTAKFKKAVKKAREEITPPKESNDG